MGQIRIEGGKKEFAAVVLVNDATELLKNTDNIPKYTFNIKVTKIKAPVQKGDVIGQAEIIDNEGNIIDEVDLTVKEDIAKANIFDYWLKNIKILGSGKTILKN